MGVSKQYHPDFDTSHHRRGRTMDRLFERAFVAKVEEVLFCEPAVALADGRVPLLSLVPPQENGDDRVEDIALDSDHGSDRSDDLSRDRSRTVHGDLISPGEPEGADLQPSSDAVRVPLPGGNVQSPWQLASLNGIGNEDLHHHYPSLVQRSDLVNYTLQGGTIETPAVDTFLTDQFGYHDVMIFLAALRNTAIRGSRESSRQPRTAQINEGRQKVVDIQKLDWNAIGIERSHALRERHRLHPFHPERRKVASSPVVDTTETIYRFSRFAQGHRATLSHDGLRNVLASSGRGNIFYASGDKVTRTSLACPHDTETLISLSGPDAMSAGFRITCIATPPLQCNSGSDALLAGGHGGEYAVLNLHDEPSVLTQGFASHSYDGIITHVNTNHDRRSGLLRAAFGSNDKHLHIMDVTTSRFIAMHAFDHEVNCSAMSADGRLRIVVGDESYALIVDADTGTPQRQLKGHNGDVVTCAWSTDGRYAATGAEDDTIMIWDVRNWSSPVQTHKSLMTTPRSLQFADDGSLVAAEDDDVVSVFEPRTFERRQAIWFFGAIAGMTLAEGGDEIVVVNSDKHVGGLLSFARVRRSGGGSRGTGSWGGTGLDVLV